MVYVLTDGADNIVQWPAQKDTAKQLNPNVSFPRNPSDSLLAAWNLFPVSRLPVPAHDPNTQAASQAPAPVKNGSQWELGWVVRNLTAEEISQQSIANAKEKFERTVRQAGSGFSDFDKTTLLALYSEIQMYRSNNTNQTPLLDAIKAQVFPAQPKQQIVAMVESRVQGFLTTAAVALGQKIKDGA